MSILRKLCESIGCCISFEDWYLVYDTCRLDEGYVAPFVWLCWHLDGYDFFLIESLYTCCGKQWFGHLLDFDSGPSSLNLSDGIFEVLFYFILCTHGLETHKTKHDELLGYPLNFWLMIAYFYFFDKLLFIVSHCT